MDPYRRLRVLFAAATAATLVACGGGGSSDSSTTVSDDDHGNSGTVTPTPSPASSTDPAGPSGDTGLSDPTLTVNDVLKDAVYLAASVRKAAAVAPHGGAAIALGKATPANGGALDAPLAACTSGSLTVGGSDSAITYTYDACKIGAYTFTGTASVSGTPASFTVDFSGTGLQLTRAGTTDTLKGNLVCTASSNASTPALCVANVDAFKWGYDVLYTSKGGQGTHQCGCEQTWNVTFHDMTTSSGTAYILASDDNKSYVTRKGDLDFLVTLDIGGKRSSYDVELEN